MITTVHDVSEDEPLREAAQELLNAAMNYWEQNRKSGLRGAVVWVQDSDGRLVILTRGEYRQTLMENIDCLHRENEDRIFSFEEP